MEHVVGKGLGNFKSPARPLPNQPFDKTPPRRMLDTSTSKRAGRKMSADPQQAAPSAKQPRKLARHTLLCMYLLLCNIARKRHFQSHLETPPGVMIIANVATM